uniref:NADH-ubiquinone oxidoreductase chain 4 n=2 Tax=Trichonotus TaxID=270660 RepID=A0A679EM75_9TELE|nr:NADH dehydrogenase subunit 4 [Trichonotus setiger]BAX03924.1 NADH dehydrogenase subunit 4 [Trichonotus elegans]BBU26054.1 NADH dehydrogenase subunit 4 [Trichonotus elegans]
MLKILVPTIMLIPTTWLSPPKWLWSSALTHSMLITLASFYWLENLTETGWSSLNSFLATDPLSTPLLVLTCWLLPLTILASQSHASKEPLSRQRLYISLLVTLQVFLIMAFGATEFMMFYLMFEATLIPTLIIITRWGNQMERLNAGVYFLFYTLASSLPLLVALLLLKKSMGGLSMVILDFSSPFPLSSVGDMIWWTACLLAFFTKMPLYGLHLWLPKAHVEAPIAGSMILAAVLLKLGGYGMIRIMPMLSPLTNIMSLPFLILALWGVVMTGTICLRQTDLKSLIAYSSVGHMGLVAAALLTHTQWALAGSVILMVAHGLTSSALFCLANANYERTQSRTMMLARGMQMALPLMSSWWFAGSLANLALPPLPNLMGELMIITALFNWSQWTLLLTGLGTLITASYSLYMYLMTQRGPLTTHLTNLPPSHSREHLLLSLHVVPLVLLVLRPELMLAWIA